MPSGISVIIPAYNRADLIGHTLQSLLRQTLPADEIIVVDDGSTDGTVEAAWAAFHQWESGRVKGERSVGVGKPVTCHSSPVTSPDFRVICQENAGPGAARNRGLAEARGQFIHFFDSDDLAAPNKHEVQIRALREFSADIAVGPWVKGRIVRDDAKMANGGWQSAEGSDRKLVTPAYRFAPDGQVFQQHGLPAGDLVKALVTRWSIVPQSCMFRRSILEKSGGFPPQMFAAEDQVLFLRCLLRGAKVIHTPRTITFYRLGHEGKLTESADGQRRRFRDWARFLLIAHEEIAASQHGSPAQWLGFRQRCWSARRELEVAGEGDGDEFRRLTKLTSGGIPSPGFAALATLQRWRGGIQARLTGSREDASFHTGPITPEQLALFPSMTDGE